LIERAIYIYIYIYMGFGLSACSKKNNINTRFGQYLNSGVGEDDVEELKGNDERTIMGMHW